MATADPTAITSSATAPAAATDLTVVAGQILTNGSAGDIEGTVRVAVRNDGPATVDLVDLTVALTSGVQPTGPAWTNCTGPDTNQTITCAEPAPAVGQSRDFTLGFAIATSKLAIDSYRQPILPSIAARPHGATNAKSTGNTVTLTMCSNGCIVQHPAVAITGLPSTPTLAVGGAALEFTVTISNVSGQTYTNITPLVSLGHCSCTGGMTSPAPAGTLQLRQPDGTWQTIQCVREGTGMDYLGQTQMPGLTLVDGATVSFTYRLSLNATQQPPVHNGQTIIDVTIVNLPDHTARGTSPAADALLNVTGS
jgi:hypothetical protein